METSGLGFHFEDLPVGRSFRTIGRTITETGHRQLHQLHGHARGDVHRPRIPEGPHRTSRAALRRAAGASTLCGGPARAGDHAAHRPRLPRHGVQRASKPVFAGDTIHVEVEVIEARRSNSRPDRGLVRTRNQIVNQHGEVVQSYTPLRMIKAAQGSLTAMNADRSD